MGADAILAAGHFDAGTMQALRGCDLPMVLVAHFHAGIHCVNDDSIYGARAMTEHLLAQGAKRLAFIGGPLANHSVAQRLKGFRQALFAAGRLADPTLEVELDATIDYGEAGRKGHARPAGLCPSRPTPSLPTTTKRRCARWRLASMLA